MENGDVVGWRMGISGLTKMEGLGREKNVCKREKGKEGNEDLSSTGGEGAQINVMMWEKRKGG